MVSWKIEPIDQKVKDFIEAQLKISEAADQATTSGIGLHPALSEYDDVGKIGIRIGNALCTQALPGIGHQLFLKGNYSSP